MQSEAFPDATVFTAALVGNTGPTDPKTWAILGDGDVYEVSAGRVFDVKDADGWKTYYAAQDTEVRGPGIVTGSRKNGPREGIFRESWNQKVMTAVMTVIVTLVLVFGMTQATNIFMFILFCVAMIVNIMTYFTRTSRTHDTMREEILSSSHIRREVFLPPDVLDRIRSNPQQA